MGNINDHGAPSTSEQFENATPEFLTFIGIACFFCLLTIILGCYNVYKHIVVPLPSQLIYKTATLVVISSPMVNKINCFRFSVK